MEKVFYDHKPNVFEFNSNDLIPFNSIFDDKNQIRHFNYIKE